MALGLNWTFAQAQSAPQIVHYQGQIVNTSTGLPLTSKDVTFTLDIMSPGTEACVLYEEVQYVNLNVSNGAFDLAVGAGTPTSGSSSLNPYPLLMLTKLFSNTTSFTGLHCQTGNSYTPALGDTRTLKVTFNDGTTTWALPQAYTMSSVPYALYADSLQGKAATDLVQINTTTAALSQNNLESIFSSPTAISNLLALENGTSSNYVKSSSTTGAALPQSSSAPSLTAEGDIWYNTATHTIQYQSDTGTLSIGTGMGASNFSNQAQNAFLAGPSSGGAGAPSFRAIASADLPTNLIVNGGNSFGAAASVGTSDSNNLTLVAGGNPQVTVQPNGNVGIGTTTPAYTLDVSGTINASISVSSSQSGTGYLQLTSGAAPSAPGGTVGNVFINSNGMLECQYGTTPSECIPSYNSGSGALGADVTMTATSTYYDGPTVAIAAGTWNIQGTVSISTTSTTSAVSVTCQLWDGTNVASSTEVTSGAVAVAAVRNMSLSLQGIVSPGTSDTYKISCATTLANQLIKAATVNNNAGKSASTIWAVRLR